ncbi:hypothetical protein [Flavobacterium sp. UMI-01]|uniref:hypothetical protein n=1 Tax=Flavobacterium sp. UMI-01 TaxID=1441053 RepID=UPI001C7D03B7|nr:hypothetical protein [Flavobacterium sp. UMI-01]GIZ08262.1 hypothetical protein FUMI01_09890 [Flavobacterium sp. UMI-01]
MKAIKVIAIGMLFAATSAIQAQVSVSLNIGTRPVWAPAAGYAAVDFYYVPEVQAYYDTHASVFVYLNGNNWVRSRYLPTHYRNVNLNHCHKVALSGYRGYRPYEYYDNHRGPQRVVYVEKKHHHYDRYDRYNRYDDDDDYKKGKNKKYYKR